MLHSTNESDSENAYLTPITPTINSISNPTYNQMPCLQGGKVNTENRLNCKPQYQNLVNRKESDSKESPVKIDVDKNNYNAHYVNSEASMWNSVDL